jgi:hypothetical protein
MARTKTFTAGSKLGVTQLQYLLEHGLNGCTLKITVHPQQPKMTMLLVQMCFGPFLMKIAGSSICCGNQLPRLTKGGFKIRNCAPKRHPHRYLQTRQQGLQRGAAQDPHMAHHPQINAPQQGHFFQGGAADP